MPPTHTDDGLRAALEIRRRWPDIGILVLSQYVEERYASELLAGDSGSIGYLLKDRIADVGEFVEAVRRVGGGRCGARPRGRRADPRPLASPRPPRRACRPVSARCSGSWPRVAATRPSPPQLVVSDGAVEKHVGNIFMKLDLAPTEGDHRRVLAVLRWLGS